MPSTRFFAPSVECTGNVRVISIHVRVQFHGQSDAINLHSSQKLTIFSCPFLNAISALVNVVVVVDGVTVRVPLSVSSLNFFTARSNFSWSFFLFFFFFFFLLESESVRSFNLPVATQSYSSMILQ